MPSRLATLLSVCDLSRARKEDKGFVVPSFGREDKNPSLWITLTEDRILLRDRAGYPTDNLLSALGWTYADLYAKGPAERLEFASYASLLEGGASDANGRQVERAEIELHSKVYSALLNRLSLSGVHRKNLLDRGFTPLQIERFGYRSLPYERRNRLIDALRADFGSVLALIPGFFLDDSRCLRMVKGAGLLIPTRSPSGDIYSLKIRQDTYPRFVYFAGGQSTSVRLMPHFTKGFNPKRTELFVTEGEMKADRASVSIRRNWCSVPGFNNWRTLLPWLEDTKTRTVVMAFDRPQEEKKQREIERAKEEFTRALEYKGYQVDELDF